LVRRNSRGSSKVSFFYDSYEPLLTICLSRVADDLAAFASPERTTVIDIFGGVGGNSIAFARSSRWNKVIAVEKDPSVIACAQVNADIYGVADQITFVNDDCFSYLSSASSGIDPSMTVIFASPPWGGPSYSADGVFDLSKMSPYSAQNIWNACKGMDCALYLPRTSDLRQIAKFAPEGKKLDVTQYCMEGASKALVAYIPAAR
jgi:trimethylguanosine synthase